MLAALYKNAQGDTIKITIDKGSMTKKNETTGKTVLSNGLTYEQAVDKARSALAHDMPKAVDFAIDGLI